MKTFLKVLLPLLLLSLTTCRHDFRNIVPEFSAFDFTAADNNWSINWRKAGMNNLHWSDVELFNVNVRLSNPAPREVKFNLQVMANGAKIGIIEFTVPVGQQVPSYVYRTNHGAKVPPAGAPPYIIESFWLACTTNHGKLRGNAGKVDAQGANVVLRLGADHSRLSASHYINCV